VWDDRINGQLEAKEGLMPLLRRRPLTRAAMVGGAGYEIGKHHQEPSRSEPVTDAASDANRIDALSKLKSLLDDGVLTQEQYDSEHARLTEGI
jgi:Short C-terminal domain